MRRLVEVDKPALARRLSQALAAREIGSEVREDEGAVEVWVLLDGDLPRARELAEAFLADPTSFEADVREGARRERASAAAEQRWQRQRERVRVSLHGAGERPLWTMGIGAMALLVTLASGFGSERALVDRLVLTTLPARMGLIEVAQGEVWRLWTPALLHFDFLHLLFNLYMWFMFGRVVEERKGWRVFVPLVAVANTGGFLAQWGWIWIVDPGGFAYAGGLSGILYALFGYVWLKGRIDPSDGLRMDPQTTMILGAWLVLGMTGMLGVANGAHVGGLLIGLAWALGDVAWYRIRRKMDGP